LAFRAAAGIGYAVVALGNSTVRTLLVTPALT